MRNTHNMEQDLALLRGAREVLREGTTLAVIGSVTRMIVTGLLVTLACVTGIKTNMSLVVLVMLGVLHVSTEGVAMISIVIALRPDILCLSDFTADVRSERIEG